MVEIEGRRLKYFKVASFHTPRFAPMGFCHLSALFSGIVGFPCVFFLKVVALMTMPSGILIGKKKIGIKSKQLNCYNVFHLGSLQRLQEFKEKFPF